MMSLDTQKQLGEKIRQARVISGLTQLKLAEIIGIGKNSMIDTEKGRRSVNTTELKLIAEATNKPLSFFYEEDHTRAYSTNKVRDLRDLENGDIELIDKLIETLRAKNNPDK